MPLGANIILHSTTRSIGQRHSLYHPTAGQMSLATRTIGWVLELVAEVGAPS